MPVVLMIEDNEDNRDIYRAILEHGGYTVFEASDGQTGVAAARTPAQMPLVRRSVTVTAWASQTVEEIRTSLDSTPEGLDHYVTGPGGYAADSADAFAGIDGVLLLVGYAWAPFDVRWWMPVAALASPRVLTRPLEIGVTCIAAHCGTGMMVLDPDYLDTRFGLYRAYVFQDIIDKHYIIALAHGDIVSPDPEAWGELG